jgi:hypothetical protein
LEAEVFVFKNLSGRPASSLCLYCRYGELGNAELVKKYGFALRQDPFTSVTLDKPKLLAAARAALGAARWRRRSRLLLRDTSVLDEDEEPFEVVMWLWGGRAQCVVAVSWQGKDDAS